MKMNKILAFLVVLLLAMPALAQNQGDDTPLGSSGTKILCNTNPSLTATASAGELNFVACGTAGEVLQSVTAIVPGTGATNLGKAEDAAHASSDAGVASLFVKQDTLSSSAADGDYTNPKVNTESATYVTDVPDDVNGMTAASIVGAATNNSTNLKASAGTLQYVHACTIDATPVYVKFYNKATAPTCGTDTPLFRLLVPAGQCSGAALPKNGLVFGTGIGYCVTTGITDADNTAVSASEVLLNIGYK